LDTHLEKFPLDGKKTTYRLHPVTSGPGGVYEQVVVVGGFVGADGGDGFEVILNPELARGDNDQSNVVDTGTDGRPTTVDPLEVARQGR
jgi:hypothetical protein